MPWFLLWGEGNISLYIHARFHGDKYKLNQQKLIQTVLELVVITGRRTFLTWLRWQPTQHIYFLGSEQLMVPVNIGVFVTASMISWKLKCFQAKARPTSAVIILSLICSYFHSFNSIPSPCTAHHFKFHLTPVLFPQPPPPPQLYWVSLFFNSRPNNAHDSSTVSTPIPSTVLHGPISFNPNSILPAPNPSTAHDLIVIAIPHT